MYPPSSIFHNEREREREGGREVRVREGRERERVPLCVSLTSSLSLLPLPLPPSPLLPRFSSLASPYSSDDDRKFSDITCKIKSSSVTFGTLDQCNTTSPTTSSRYSTNVNSATSAAVGITLLLSALLVSLL